jgi:hypothetical protein
LGKKIEIDLRHQQSGAMVGLSAPNRPIRYVSFLERGIDQRAGDGGRGGGTHFDFVSLVLPGPHCVVVGPSGLEAELPVFVFSAPDVFHQLIEQTIQLPEELALLGEFRDRNLYIRQIEERVLE